MRPPEQPEDPVTVRLRAVGRHAGLLLPCADGRTVEYGYGEWGWYARLKNAWWRAPLIMLWPHTGTLGRRYVREGDLAGGYYAAGELHPFAVAGEDAAKLVARLDAEFAGGEPFHNAVYDVWFVKHGDSFCLVHNCHDEVAEWLESLGCEVSWAPIRTGLELE